MPRGTGFGTIEAIATKPGRKPTGYRIRYRGPDGKRYREAGFRTKELARKRLDAISTQIVMKTWESPDLVVVSYTLAEYVEIVFTRLEGMGRKPRTIEEYRRYWKRHIASALGKHKLTDITPVMVASWYAKLCPKTPTERAHTYAFLRSVLLSAERDGLIDRCPCNLVGAGSVKRAGRTDLPTDVQVMLAVAFMPPPYRLMVQLGGALGLRSGEVRGLKRGDIDLAAGVVRVRRNLSRYGGRENETTTKTVNSVRDLPIRQELIPVVRDHLDRFVEPRDDALLFPGPRGGMLTIGTFHNYWEKAREMAGIPNCRFHDLRHYAATMAIVFGGATTQEALRMLGQTDSRVLNRYIDAVRGRDREIAERMPSLVG